MRSSNPWLAWPPGTDRSTLDGRLRRAHEAFLTSGRASPHVRPLVLDSWRRSLTSGVDSDDGPPVELGDAELRAHRDAHPLAAAMPLIRRLLVEYATDVGLVVAVSDSSGRLLWVEGDRALRERAARMHFVEGASWDEAHAGTNAPGVALALDHPVQVFAGEHFSRVVQPWSCSAAPVHSPLTGQLLGAIDVTGGDDVAAPSALALVRAAASAVELELRHALPDLSGQAYGRHVRLRVLGQLRGLFRQEGGDVRLSLRHSELALLLSMRPRGVSGDELVIALHESEGSAVSVRVEMSRLRRVLPDLSSRPYRLASPLVTDVHVVQERLANGDVVGALSVYAGPVLPRSDAPAVVALREDLRAHMRAALMAQPELAPLLAYGRMAEGQDDVEVWEACLRRSRPGAAARPEIVARLGRWTWSTGCRRAETSLLPPGTYRRATTPPPAALAHREDAMSVYAPPGQPGSPVEYKPRYDHWIGGDYVAPAKGQYFEDPSPVTGQTFTEVARGTAEDVERALDAAHAAAPAWGKTSVAVRADILNKIADRIEANLEKLAVDHFRYFAGVLRAQEGSISVVDEDTIAYHFHEPLGVVGQIIPWNFPMLMATWKLAPALAAGNAVVLKPAEQTPASILLLNELIADLLPAGVLNIVNGFGVEAGKPLASSNRVRKIAFTGETTTGRLIMQYASQNIIPVTLELGGKSPNIFFEDVARARDDFYDKALEGFTMFAFNQGEVCTCPSRALIQSSIVDSFLADATERTKAATQGNPLDTETMVGAQASNDQVEKILSYFEIGRAEGARVVVGGERAHLDGDLAGGYFVTPTIFEGDNSMRIFQEEIFGPVVSVARFDDFDDAIKIANDTLYGLGAGVWSRDLNTAYRAGRAIEAGRVWTNCYHAYPAHAAFGGYKGSGVGRENHKMMLDHYQQTKNLLVSYSPQKLGYF